MNEKEMLSNAQKGEMWEIKLSDIFSSSLFPATQYWRLIKEHPARSIAATSNGKTCSWSKQNIDLTGNNENKRRSS